MSDNIMPGSEPFGYADEPPDHEGHDCGEDTCAQIEQCCRHRGECDYISESDYEDGDPNDAGWLDD